MSVVRKLMVPVLAAGLLVGVIAIGTGNAAPKVLHLTEHARVATLDAHTIVGQVTGGPNGKYGTQIAHFTVKGNKIVGTSVGYNPDGSTIARFAIKLTVNADGSSTYRGAAKITGGTGAYRNARGTIKVTGHSAKNATIAFFTYKVSITL
jgi:hypothetical protein